MEKVFEFRVRSTSCEKIFYKVRLHQFLKRCEVYCECHQKNPFSKKQFCSHIDAPLFKNCFSVVFEEDRDVAIEASKIAQNGFKIPKSWKETWRTNKKWLGPDYQIFDKKETTHVRTSSLSGRKVCFTGDPKMTINHKKFSRRDFIDQAKEKGWEVSEEFSGSLDYLICHQAGSKESTKMKHALQLNIPIISYQIWIDQILCKV